MTLVTFKDLCIDVNDLEAGAAFWASALGLDIFRYEDGGIRLDGPTPQHRVWPCVVPEPHTVKNRVHLDVVAASLEPFRDLTQLTGDGEFRWTTFADPEGNEFCAFVIDNPPAYRLKAVAVDAVDHDSITRWWAEIWGGTLVHDEEGYSYIEDIPGAPFESFDFVPVPEPKTVKNRVHWDVILNQGVTIEDLVAAGATVLRPPDDEIQWTVMADPEGNEFCAFAPK